MKLVISIFLLFLASCASTHITPQGKKVVLLSYADPKECRFIKKVDNYSVFHSKDIKVVHATILNEIGNVGGNAGIITKVQRSDGLLYADAYDCNSNYIKRYLKKIKRR